MKSLLMKYFVLKPKGEDAYAEASRTAMMAYALSIQEENHVFAEEIMEWVDEERRIIEARNEKD